MAGEKPEKSGSANSGRAEWLSRVQRQGSKATNCEVCGTEFQATYVPSKGGHRKTCSAICHRKLIMRKWGSKLQ